MKVYSEGGENKAYIAASEIAGKIETEVTYEFTYYAKLAAGVDSGEVEFRVTSASSDWNSQELAKIELDNEITLDTTQWKQVSGTFRIPAHDKHSQVKVEFSGSDSTSFCIDDLRIAAVKGENTGNDREIQEFVMGFKEAGQFLEKLEDMVKFLIPNYITEGKTQLVIGIGCTGGKHRSVTLANALYQQLRQEEAYGVKIEHRDIGKDALRNK